MGTTESILESSYGGNDDVHHESPSSPASWPSPRHDIPSSLNSVYKHSASPRHRGDEVERNENQKITSPVHRKQEQRHRLSQTGFSKGGEPHQSQHMHLRGLILGMAKTGKRTLLQRFQGKDPYLGASSNQRQQGNSTLYDQNEEFTIPYQTNRTVWEEGIELKLQVLPELVTNEQLHRMENVDFFIILVHPHHSAQAIQSYLEAVLDFILQSKDYSMRAKAKNDDSSGGRQPNLTDQPPRRPVCICILRNFRDLEPNHPASSSSSSADPSVVSVTDLEQWAEDALHDFPVLSRERLVFQVDMASLRNCYGLNSLHHFIYRSYLQRKQWDTEQRLREIRQQVQQASIDVPHVTYEAFSKLVQATTTTSTANQPPLKQRLRQLQLQGAQASPDSVTTNQSDESKTVPAPYVTPSTVSPRRIVQPIVKEETNIAPRIHVENSRQSLESFLESDDDDDDVVDGINPGEDDDDHDDGGGQDEDDDDDSFFYDDTGKRHGSSSPGGQKKMMASSAKRKTSSSLAFSGDGRPKSVPAAATQTTSTLTSDRPSKANVLSETPNVKDESKQHSTCKEDGIVANITGLVPASIAGSKHLTENIVADNVNRTLVTLKEATSEINVQKTSSHQSRNIQCEERDGQQNVDTTSEDHSGSTATRSEKAGAVGDDGINMNERLDKDGHDVPAHDGRGVPSSKDIVSQISELEIEDGWDDDNYDDEDVDKLENMEPKKCVSAKNDDDENNDNDDGGYVIGEDRQTNEGPNDVISPNPVINHDDDDFVINEHPATEDIKENGEPSNSPSPAAPSDIQSTAEVATKAALSHAALEAIAEAERNAERMLRENNVDDRQLPAEKAEKKSKTKKKDKKDPAKKKKKEKKRRDNEPATANGEDN